MNTDQTYLIAIAFPLGIAALGIGAYMLDQIQKNAAPKKIDTNSPTFLVIILLTPFIYLGQAINKKSAKGVIVFVLFFAALVTAGQLANIVNSSQNKVEPGNREVRENPAENLTE